MACAVICKFPASILSVHQTDYAPWINILGVWSVSNAPIGYHTPDGVYAVVPVTLFSAPAGYHTVGTPTYSMDANFNVTQTFSVALDVLVASSTFFARLTDTEMKALWAAMTTNAGVLRWVIQTMMVSQVDLSASTTIAAKAAAVSLGILTQARADAVFAV